MADDLLAALAVGGTGDAIAIGPLNSALVAKLIPRVDAPAVQGPPPLEAAKAFLTGLAQGKVERSTLSADFDAFLTPELVAAAKQSLGRQAPISAIEVGPARERGGMEVATVRFKARSTPAQALMYRSPAGKIEEFLISR